MSTRSLREAALDSSAPSTRLFAEPSKARRSRSPASVLLRRCWLVHVGLKTFAADEQTLFGHQLHLLERGGVAVAFVERPVNVPDRGRSQAPKDGENIEFGIGR